MLPVDATAAEASKAREKTLEEYPELLDFYIAEREHFAKEASFDSAEKVSQANALFIEQLKELVGRLAETDFYKKPVSSYEDALARVRYLKKVVEDKDGYKIFYVGGKPVKREQDLQIMFKLTWLASAFDYNAEVNNGRGPADFSASYGKADKTIIEFKLAGSSSLERNLQMQAEIYAKAAEATHAPIKVILHFSDKELARVERFLRTHGLTGREEIVLIDASPYKTSASKAR